MRKEVQEVPRYRKPRRAAADRKVEVPFYSDAYAAPDIYLPVPRQKNGGGFPWPVILVFLAAVSAAVGVAAGTFYWLASDWIMPGTTVMGQDIGGQHMAEAAITLQDHWRNQEIRLISGSTSWSVSPDTLGMALDAQASAEAAHQIGRTIDSLGPLWDYRGKITLLPVWYYDPQTARAYLEGQASRFYMPPTDAGIRIVSGRAEVLPPRLGSELNVNATLNMLSADPSGVYVSGELPLITASIQPSITDTSAVAAAANELLLTNIILHAYDPIADESTDIVLPPEQWGNWLSLAIVDPAAGTFNWELDEAKLRSFLEEQNDLLGENRYLDTKEAAAAIVDAISSQSVDSAARIYHGDRTHVVQAGETLSSIGRDYGIPYPWIEQANPELDGNLFVGQSITIPSPDQLLPLPVVRNKRIEVSISQQRTRVYENSQLIWDWPASTGIDDSPTAPGIFQIQSHEINAYASIWDLWMPNFMGVYRPAPDIDFMNGFHGFPTRNGANLLWTNNLGRKVTFGCILLSSENAAALYDWAEEGVVVEITP